MLDPKFRNIFNSKNPYVGRDKDNDERKAAYTLGADMKFASSRVGCRFTLKQVPCPDKKATSGGAHDGDVLLPALIDAATKVKDYLQALFPGWTADQNC